MCCLFSVLTAATSTYSQSRLTRTLGLDRSLILTTVTVYNKQGGLAADLNKAAFTLFDNQEAQEITYFTNEDQPIWLGLVVDGIDPRGEKQPDRTIKLIAEALGSFFDKSNRANEYFPHRIP